MSAGPDRARPTAIVVMRVSGCGKSTLAARLSNRLSRPFVEADELHPAADVAKMAAGTPLTDADREPWLRLVRDRVDELGTDVVVTCSALRRSYRDVLRSGRARVRFVHLAGSADLLGTRIGARAGHFMPASLLTSQIETLEPLEPDEDGVVLDVTQRPEQLVDEAVAALVLRTGLASRARREPCVSALPVLDTTDGQAVPALVMIEEGVPENDFFTPDVPASGTLGG